MLVDALLLSPPTLLSRYMGLEEAPFYCLAKTGRAERAGHYPTPCSTPALPGWSRQVGVVAWFSHS